MRCVPNRIYLLAKRMFLLIKGPCHVWVIYLTSISIYRSPIKQQALLHSRTICWCWRIYSVYLINVCRWIEYACEIKFSQNPTLDIEIVAIHRWDSYFGLFKKKQIQTHHCRPQYPFPRLYSLCFPSPYTYVCISSLGTNLQNWDQLASWDIEPLWESLSLWSVC
jgi:hypothetical protein